LVPLLHRRTRACRGGGGGLTGGSGSGGRTGRTTGSGGRIGRVMGGCGESSGGRRVGAGDREHREGRRRRRGWYPSHHRRHVCGVEGSGAVGKVGHIPGRECRAGGGGKEFVGRGIDGDLATRSSTTLSSPSIAVGNCAAVGTDNVRRRRCGVAHLVDCFVGGGRSC